MEVSHVLIQYWSNSYDCMLFTSGLAAYKWHKNDQTAMSPNISILHSHTQLRLDCSCWTKKYHWSMNDVHSHTDTHIDWAVNERSQDNRNIQEADPLFKQETVIKGNTVPSWVVCTPAAIFSDVYKMQMHTVSGGWTTSDGSCHDGQRRESSVHADLVNITSEEELINLVRLKQFHV